MPTDTAETTETPAAEKVTVERYDGEGEVMDTVELDAGIFGVTPNVPLLHQVVTAQRAARRSGTQSTRTRAEVAGGGAKPYRQKGTGRARQGTIRAPHYSGGGVALGPKPRSYAQHTPRKMVRLALHSALSDRHRGGKLRLVDTWPFEVPKTKDAVALLGALEVDGRVLVVLTGEDTLAERSFGNLPHVRLVEAAQLTAYEVLASDWVLFTTASIPGGVTVVEGSAPKKPRKKATAKKAAASKKATASKKAAASGPDEAVEGEESAATDEASGAGDEQGSAEMVEEVTETEAQSEDGEDVTSETPERESSTTDAVADEADADVDEESDEESDEAADEDEEEGE